MESRRSFDDVEQVLTGAARTVTGAPDDYDALLDLVGDRRLVLIGEASHGTHEFYRERARITRRLIDDLGFTAVAVEADWPDAYRVNRYVMGMSDDADADAALEGFLRFPTWMWRNRDVLGFVQWLRARNDAQSHPAAKARFYGLDLYSLRTSIEAVVAYLDQVDPSEAERARHRYSCFDHVGADGQAYGYAARPPAAPRRARTRSSPNWWSCGAGPRSTCGGTAGSPRTSSSTPSRTRSSSGTPRSTTTRCTGPRCRRGTSATSTWRARSTR